MKRPFLLIVCLSLILAPALMATDGNPLEAGIDETPLNDDSPLADGDSLIEEMGLSKRGFQPRQDDGRVGTQGHRRSNDESADDESADDRSDESDDESADDDRRDNHRRDDERRDRRDDRRDDERRDDEMRDDEDGDVTPVSN